MEPEYLEGNAITVLRPKLERAKGAVYVIVIALVQSTAGMVQSIML